ncbi:MAG TPA: MFS transporter [Chloroflexota bacterium]|nr:MFS transporter [Chloroflexota bacterium]
MRVDEPRQSWLNRTFASFQAYNYRLYWSGQFVSFMGTWMQRVGQSWLVLELTHSPIALGLVSALQTLPVLLFTLFAGVLVDRWPKHQLLMVTQSAALVQALLLATLTVFGRIQVWQIDVLALMLGFINALDNPTRQTFVTELVPQDKVLNAISLNSAQMNCSRLLGPAIGGVIVGTLGAGVCFFINAASFLATMLSLLLMRRAEFNAPAPARSSGRALSGVVTGMRYIFRAPELMTVIIVLAGIGCFGYNWNTVTPLVASDLHEGAEGFGFLLSALGIGSVIGAVTTAGRRDLSTKVLMLAALGFGVAYMGIAFAPVLAVAFALYAGLGFAGVTFTSLANSTLQLSTPHELRGRVMAVFTMLMQGSTPIGSLFTGVVAAAAGIRVTVAAEASLCLLGLALAVGYWSRFAGRATRPTAPAEALAV